MDKNTFVISCPIDTYSGYGARSRDVVKAIIELDKYDVKIIPQRWGETTWGFIEENEEWHFLKEHLITPNLKEQPEIWCQITVPNEFQPVGKYNIGITAGIETTVCDAGWIEGLNKMNLNLVSSNHSKRVFETTQYEKKDERTNQTIGILKVEKPIEVLFEGVDVDTYLPIKKNDFWDLDLYKDINSIKEDFAYLFVGHWLPGEMGEDRKNVGLMVKAFYETFKNKQNTPALIMKCNFLNSSYLDRREIMHRINIIKNSVDAYKLPSIYLINGDFTNSEMNELYNHPRVKAMVSFTKGEGFGRPLLEFSMTNKPVIASAWSGQTDFLKPEHSLLVGGRLTNIHPSAQSKNMLLDGSQWFTPDNAQVSHCLVSVFEDYKTWKLRGKKQGHYSRTNFSLGKMMGKIDELLGQYMTTIPKTQQLKLPKLTLPKLKKLENAK